MSDQHNLVELFTRRKMLVFIGLAPLAGSVRVIGSTPNRLGFRLAQFSFASGFEQMFANEHQKPVYVPPDDVLTENDVESARIVSDANNRIAFTVNFSAQCDTRLRTATRGHIEKPMAILLDGRLIIAPIVRFEISRSATITGDYTDDQLCGIFTALSVDPRLL